MHFDEAPENKMAKRLGSFLAPVWLLMVAACSGDNPRPAWNDIDVIRENVEAPRAHFVPYRSVDAALAGDEAGNRWRQSLNGNWKFSYSATPSGRPEGFHEAPPVLNTATVSR